MTKEFKLTQLFRTGRNDIGGSIEHKKEEKVDCKIQMSSQSKEGLWKFVETDWHKTKIAVVEFDGYYEDGFTPINPVITHVKYES